MFTQKNKLKTGVQAPAIKRQSLNVTVPAPKVLHKSPTLLFVIQRLIAAVFTQTSEAWDEFNLYMNLRLFRGAIRRTTGLLIDPQTYIVSIDDYKFNWDTHKQCINVVTTCEKCMTTYESNPVYSFKQLSSFIIELGDFDCKSIRNDKIQSLLNEPASLYSSKSVNYFSGDSPTGDFPHVMHNRYNFVQNCGNPFTANGILQRTGRELELMAKRKAQFNRLKESKIISNTYVSNFPGTPEQRKEKNYTY